ncbi:MAG: nicotinate (nicotinamide) nucleotide adenylyltransferase [Candidatus Aminicenantes bacterium RBG_16_63_16]|nr:MAG: nicotinate (nicotinamide) nucleotide adenylyltransferase [Candidatus Aminicenantes bacterium RBG_16_63_16]
MPKKRVGLLGGTFNPVHAGHLHAAEEVRRRAGLRRVLFIPSYIPPHKQSAEIASPEDRFAMVRLAVKGHPAFEASPIEIDARETSYSIITLNKVKSLHEDSRVFFILGIDAFVEIETWKSYRELLAQCQFIVISRPGHRLDEARRALPGDYAGTILDLPELLPLTDGLADRYRIFLVSIDALDISSTDIRRRVRQGQPVSGLVPEAVDFYIHKKKLYQE